MRSPRIFADASRSFDIVSTKGLEGLTRKAKTLAVGTSSCNASSRFRHELDGQTSHARDVIARPVQARDKSERDRVGADPEDDRNCAGCCLCGECRRTSIDRGYHRYLAANEIGGQLRQSIVLAIRPPIFDTHVPSLDIAGFLETLAERAQQVRMCLRRITVDEPYHWHHQLLSTRDQRPIGRDATDKGDEIAPPHVTPEAKAKGYLPTYTSTKEGVEGGAPAPIVGQPADVQDSRKEGPNTQRDQHEGFSAPL
jgi:hypothetical protein